MVNKRSTKLVLKRGSTRLRNVLNSFEDSCVWGNRLNLRDIKLYSGYSLHNFMDTVDATLEEGSEIELDDMLGEEVVIVDIALEEGNSLTPIVLDLKRGSTLSIDTISTTKGSKTLITLIREEFKRKEELKRLREQRIREKELEDRRIEEQRLREKEKEEELKQKELLEDLEDKSLHNRVELNPKHTVDTLDIVVDTVSDIVGGIIDKEVEQSKEEKRGGLSLLEFMKKHKDMRNIDDLLEYFTEEEIQKQVDGNKILRKKRRLFI